MKSRFRWATGAAFLAMAAASVAAPIGYHVQSAVASELGTLG